MNFQKTESTTKPQAVSYIDALKNLNDQQLESELQIIYRIRYSEGCMEANEYMEKLHAIQYEQGRRDIQSLSVIQKVHTCLESTEV